jgi:integrase
MSAPPKYRLFADVLRAFMSEENPHWGQITKGTRDSWGRYLRLAQERDTLGGVKVKDMRPALVLAFLDGLASKPGAQMVAFTALKAVDKWAVARDHLPRSITFGVRVDGTEGGHLPWSDAQVELAEREARLCLSRAVTLAANTSQRGSDLVRMAATDIETYNGRTGINVCQVKTGKVVWVPFTEPLMRAFDAGLFAEIGPLLRKDDGSAWTRQQLSSAWLRERDTNPALAPLRGDVVEVKSTNDTGLVIHGLRGTGCVRLRRVGATIPQIADMAGMSEGMVARYCRFALQKENALAAVVMLDEARERKKRDAG